MTARSGRTWRLVQLTLTVLFVAFAGWYLWRQWSETRGGLAFQFDALWLLLASVVVLGTYALLIETWRQVLARLGSRVAFAPAARIWFVSNLGKYVPGKIWQVSAMTIMVGEHGVPLPAAGASAVVITIANVATGFAVVLLTSAATVRRLAGGTAAVIAVTLGLALVLVAAPLIAAQWNRLARGLGKEELSVDVPLSAIWVAVAGCAASWLLYGWAFQLFVRSLLGDTDAPIGAFITAHAASYLVGYLTLFAPGGIGVREIVLSSILVPLRIATAPQAAVITVASRLWLTVLEIAPSLIALARGNLSPAAAGSRSDRGTPPTPP